MMHNKKTAVMLAAAAGTAMLLSGCGGGDATSDATATAAGASAGAAAEGMSVQILLPFPQGLPLAPVVIAQEQGQFADNGIENVEVSVADGSGFVSQQLVAGNANFALMGSADVALAASKRDDVRVLFCHQAHNVYRIAALADSGVTDLAGMAGKTLGITEPGGGENVLVNAALAAAGLTESVTTLPIGGAGPQSLAAIQDGKVQAYASSFPDFAALSTEGVSFVDITPDKFATIPGTCMVTTQEFLDSPGGKEAAIAVTKSWIDAESFALANPDEALQVVCGAVPSACENEAAAKALFTEALAVMAPEEGGRVGDTTPEVWATVVEVLSGAGVVPAELDMTAVVSGGTVDEVRSAAYGQ